MTRPRKSFRLSLRELLLLVALVAMALASIRYASSTWRTAVYTITMAVFIWGAIVAIIDRGPRQAFAIGLVLTMMIYAVLVRNGVREARTENRELHPDLGRLPTTWVSRYIYRPVTTVRWFDRTPGSRRAELVNYDPNNPPPGVLRAIRDTDIDPLPDLFMQIVHCWWALLLGYLGGRFAGLVYIRRVSETPAITLPG
jgi:hypothetical protein